MADCIGPGLLAEPVNSVARRIGCPVACWLGVLLMLQVTGCGGKDEPYRKPTAKVTGQVTVDGKAPTDAIKVMCHPVDGMDQEHPSVSQCMTGDQGKFEISTYQSGDGVPEGEYVLTFLYGQLNLVSMNYGGPDKLKGRYSDPSKSEWRLSVKGSTPVDLGVIALTTQ